jgi:hypothetical protein
MRLADFGSFFSWKTWGCDGVSNGPSFFESLSNASTNDADSRAPFGLAKFFAIERNQNIGSTVLTLFLCCFPTAIVGRVWAVVINSTKAVFGRRPRTHVLVEVLKRRHPSFTNGNASVSVESIPGTFAVETPRLHGSPDTKLGRVSKTVSESRLQFATNVTKLGHLFSALFNMQASARPGVTIAKIRNDACLLVPAVAQAQKLPLLGRCSIRQNREHNHSTVAFSDKFRMWDSACHDVAVDTTRRNSFETK